MKKIIDVTFWLAVFPVSFLFAYAINLLVALILAKIIGETGLGFLETFIFPATFDFLIILCLYATMPTYPIKKRKIILVFSVIVILLNILTAFTNPLSDPTKTLSRLIVAILGIGAGIYLVINKSERVDI